MLVLSLLVDCPRVPPESLEAACRLVLSRRDGGKPHMALTCPDSHLKKKYGASLVIQWLRLTFQCRGMQVQSLVKKLRSHKPWGQKKKTKAKHKKGIL